MADLSSFHVGEYVLTGLGFQDRSCTQESGSFTSWKQSIKPKIPVASWFSFLGTLRRLRWALLATAMSWYRTGRTRFNPRSHNFCHSTFFFTIMNNPMCTSCESILGKHNRLPQQCFMWVWRNVGCTPFSVENRSCFRSRLWLAIRVCISRMQRFRALLGSLCPP